MLVVGIESAMFGTTNSDVAWLFVSFSLGGAVYTTAGLIAWSRRPNNKLGLIMVGAGYVWLLAALGNSGVTALVCVGVITATVPLAMVVHLLLAFPSGRISTGRVRVIVGAGFFVALVLQLPSYLFRPSASPNGILAIADLPRASLVGEWVQRGTGLAVMIATGITLVGRWRRASPAQRRVLTPLYVYGVVAVLAVPIVPTVIAPLLGLPLVVTVTTQLVLLTGIPIAFTLGVLLGGYASTGEIQELGSWLADRSPQRFSLEEALAHTLGDPSLRLGRWSPAQSQFVGADGLGLPSGSGRVSIAIEAHGEPVGMINYDAIRIDDPEMVRAAGRVVAIAVDQEQLTTRLQASERALQIAGRRTVEAADRERSRIAQDLHDGMQAQLVAIALGVQQLAANPAATAQIRTEATRLRVAIDASARELRELVHGILPAALIERGLASAVEDLADRMAVPVHLDLQDLCGPLPSAIQRTAYFIVAECLTNAARHAQATRIEVRLRRTGAQLVVEIEDDGIGGAQVGSGLGLRGIADRIELLGGKLTVSSPAGVGTRVGAELPCEL